MKTLSCVQHNTSSPDGEVSLYLLPVDAIELDTSIQCRADIDIATVNEYAEAMQAGDSFPPIDVFGTEEKCWIGDGWHRVMAARSISLEAIPANLFVGGRIDALKAALSANALHGRRRTNADKRCSVAIALREWGKLSDRAIAEMCAVSDRFVNDMRRALNPGANGSHLPTRTGRDGKQYPAPEPAPNLTVHFSTGEDDWHTPPAVLERVTEALGTIELDPCSNSGVPNVPAERHYTAEDDGLKQTWNGRVYMNPPYGRPIGEWIEKLCSEYEAGTVTEAIALVPARTDTEWFQRLRDAAICFIDGRLKFSGHDNSAPFPSCACYLGSDVEGFTAAFGNLGDIWVRWQRG